MNLNSLVSANKIESLSIEFSEMGLNLKCSFDERKFADTILGIFDSARKNISNYNCEEKSFQIILATSEESHFPFLFSCLRLVDQEYYRTAKVLCVILETKYFDEYGIAESNKSSESKVFMTSAKIEAEKLDYSLQEIFEFSGEKIKNVFKIPQNYEPKAIFTIGLPNYLLQQIDLLM